MSVDSEKDLQGLKQAGRVVALALKAMGEAVREGITTAELDRIAAGVLAEPGTRSAPQLVYGFPGPACISVNDEAVHGIPGSRQLQRGDLVTLDVTVELDGYYADAAVTVGVPPVSDESDGWTITSDDGSLTAHYEHTLVITKGHPLLLTAA